MCLLSIVINIIVFSMEDFEKIENINSKSSSEIFNEILDITDFYNKINILKLINDYT